MIKRNYLKIIAFVAIIFCFSTTHASHVSGGNITYECLGNGDYEITLTLYRDCEGITAPTAPSINIDGCGTTQNLSLTQVGTSSEVSQLCPTNLPNSSCNGGTLPGVEEYTYSAIVNLADCDCYTFSYELCCRNNAITNINGASADDIYIESTMCSQTLTCNNSPIFTAQPIPYVCVNQPVNYDYGVVEPDGHTLEFALVSALDGGGIPVTYNAPYTAGSPIPGITCDPNTGALNFTPTTTGVFVVVIEVTEYDGNGNVIGTYMQDIQFVVQNCTNTNPDPPGGGMTNTTGSGYSTGPNSFELCEGQDFCFDYTFSDVDASNVLTLSSNVTTALPGATFNVTGTNPATATICWTAPGGTAGTHSFNILAEDDACPINGFSTATFTVNVIGSTTAGPDQTICGNQGAQINANGGTVFNWNVISGDPINVGTNFSCNPCSDPIASPSVTTTYEVVSNLTGSCVNRDTITINVVPDFTYTVDYNNNSCLMQDIDITVTPSPAGAYTYNWSPGTYLNDPTIPNPTATFTSPGTYDYDVTITSPDGCVKTEPVSINVNTTVQPTVILDYYDTTVCPGTVLAGSGPGAINAALDAQPPSSCGPSPTTVCSGPSSNSTIGTNNGQNDQYGWPAPYGNWYRNAKHQFLFTAAELQAMGMTAGKIFMIEWETVAQNGATAQFFDYTIKMGCTSSTSLTTWETGLTQVFDPKTVNVTNGANLHIFDQAYEWDGVSNLVVEICYDNLSLGYTYNWSTPYTNTAFTSTLYYRSDVTPACPYTGAPSTSTNRPVTKFYHCLVQPNPNNYDWEWSPTVGVSNPMTQNPDITANTTTTYTVTVTDPNGGCTDSAELNVTVPTIMVNTDTSVCANQNVPLQANNNGIVGTCPGATEQYTWYTTSGNGNIDNPNTDTTFANPSVSTMYYVDYTDGCGCTVTDSVFVDIGGATTTYDTIAICPGDQATVHGNLVGPGDYAQTFSLGLGCDSISDVHVYEVVPVQVVAPADMTVCEQDQVTLSGSGVQSYAWDNGVTDGVPFTVNNTTTYTVTGTDANGCETTDQTVITTNPLDDASFTINQNTFCQTGANPVVTVTGLNGGTFSSDPATLAIDPVTGSIDLASSPLGTYDVIYSVNVNCPNSDTVSITISSTAPADFIYQNAAYCANDVDPSPNFDIDNDGNPDGVAGTFSSTAGLIIDPATGVVDLDASTPGTYTVTNDVNVPGCTPTSASTQITIHGLPTATIAGDSVICQGDPLPSLVINLTGTGPFTIVYDHNGTQSTITQLVSSNTDTITNAAAGNYTLVSVTSADGCSGQVSGNASVTVNALPTVNAISSPIEICVNDMYNVPAFTTTPANATVNWTATSDVGFGTSGTGNIGNFTANAVGQTTVTAIPSNGSCVGSPITFNINVLPLPSIAFTSTTQEGCSPLALSFVNNSPGTGVNCTWDFGDGSKQLGCAGASHTYTSEGCFDVSLEMTSSNGCVNEVTYPDFICVRPNPEADFVYNPANPDVNNPTVEFDNTSIGGTYYTWNFGVYASSSEKNPTITFPSNPETYPVQLVAINEYGCTDTATSVVVVDDVTLFYIPNAFTPDGDAHNQTFKPIMTSGFDPYDYNLKIFNRWGEIIFESNNAQVGWDGTFQGQLVQDGTYIWQIEFKESMSDKRRNYSGHVNLLK